MIEQDSVASRSLKVPGERVAAANEGIRQEIALLEFLTELARRRSSKSSLWSR